ncbi:NADH dehydrogenase [ubiquinone] 1 subunit C1, mitochondrial isoform X1 [Perca fluviatilis]|uniref:NADH dehydrogenase [ubiquinone] 1 subunit C1, mitochondrial isoform X1 n=1 Tax=Perca fluviatilis TaxID=8168 RepID=UPI0019625C43|nr:NADH dehydrogenase [ubiquinone] 1 subunit C1, mitochondrial isoform X1 [Perca fluviatilis]
MADMCFSSGSGCSLSLRVKHGQARLTFGSRSVFTSSKPDTANPNWVRVGLAFGTSAFLWGLLFKQHSTDVHEYKVRNGLE